MLCRFSRSGARGQNTQDLRRDLMRASEMQRAPFPSSQIRIPVRSKRARRVQGRIVVAETPFLQLACYLFAAVDVPLAYDHC
eukprot:712428-Lingulodinium_polyedra.AAC.1